MQSTRSLLLSPVRIAAWERLRVRRAGANRSKGVPHGNIDRRCGREGHHSSRGPPQTWLAAGDAVALIESAEGLLVYHGGVDPQTLAWWQALSDEDKQHAVEARHYEALSDAERDALWNEGAETLEANAEDDERELPAS